ncbi:MAG: hypothetical protein ACKESC_00650 [Candidatus Hodgkinia cicadicola]
MGERNWKSIYLIVKTWSLFYCLSLPIHARKLLNRTGLIISKGVYTSVGKSISSINSV